MFPIFSPPLPFNQYLPPNITPSYPPYQEVSLSTLYAAAKLHDTLKKPRDLILASYAIRHPELLKGRLTLSVDPASIDPKQLESERKRILSIERLVLETLCFNFIVGAEGSGSPGLDVFGLSIKLGKRGGCELNLHMFCISDGRIDLLLPRTRQEKVYLHGMEDDH